MSYQLRQFEFYNLQIVENPPDIFDGEGRLVSTNNLIYLIKENVVYTLSSNLTFTQLQIFDLPLKVTCLIPLNSLLIMMGENEQENNKENAVIKIYDCDRTSTFLNRKVNVSDKQQPQLIKTIKVNHSASKVTSFVVSNDCSLAVVGFQDGLVVLIKGNLAKDRFLKQKILHSCSEQITGLVLNEVKNKDNRIDVQLFITTERQVLVCKLTGKEEKMVLDEQGCSLGGASLISTEFHQGLSLARDDAFYFYSVDGRGPCLAYEGVKNFTKWYNSKLVLTSPQANPDRLTILDRPGEWDKEPKLLEIYDLANRVVALSVTLSSPIVDVVSAFNGFFAYTADGGLHRIEEKDLSNKVELLLNQDLYHLAVTMARQEGKGSGDPLAEAELRAIYQKYGDFLYAKGDYDDAMQQYLHTIGYLEPSYVIRKFLDAQRLHALTTYLQQLHSDPNRLANPDHTTLLLNCYAKLKDLTKLDTFIRSPEAGRFDLDTAAKVLRQANFFDQALYLAERYNDPELYLSVKLEDLHDATGCVDYLRNLLSSEAVAYLHSFGRALLKLDPENTVQLLLQLCLEHNVSEKVASPTFNSRSQNNRNVQPLQFVKLFVGDDATLMQFLELYCAKKFDCKFDNPSLDSSSNKRKSKTNGESGSDSVELKKIWVTLLELYLDAYTNRKDEDTDTLVNKLMGLLKNDVDYDANQAVVMCKLAKFDQGTLYLYEKLGMLRDIILYYQSTDDAKAMLEALRKFGPRDHTLYPLALEYFATSAMALLTSPIEFKQVLDVIDGHQLLPPTQVLQTLSRNSVATVGNLKAYVTKAINADRTQIDQDMESITAYQKATEEKQQEIEQLLTKPSIFQHTKCSSCSRMLDLPAYHFLCHHSFHQRCLGQSSQTCPLCHRNDSLVLELMRRMEVEANDHHQFLHQLEEADGPSSLDLILESYGKNAFQFQTGEST